MIRWKLIRRQFSHRHVGDFPFLFAALLYFIINFFICCNAVVVLFAFIITFFINYFLCFYCDNRKLILTIVTHYNSPLFCVI